MQQLQPGTVRPALSAADDCHCSRSGTCQSPRPLEHGVSGLDGATEGKGNGHVQQHNPIAFHRRWPLRSHQYHRHHQPVLSPDEMNGESHPPWLTKDTLMSSLQSSVDVQGCRHISSETASLGAFSPGDLNYYENRVRDTQSGRHRLLEN